MNAGNLDSIGDSSLWTSFRAGDTVAFRMIYERHIDRLTNYGLRISANRELVKDAIHDLFVDLWKHRSTLGSTDTLPYYLSKALRRNLIKKIRARRRRQGEDIVQLNPDQWFEFSHELKLVTSELAAEQLQRLQNELDKLSSRQKEILYLRYYSGFSPAEISQILEINSQSVYNHMHRGLETLRENLNYSAITALLVILADRA